MWTELCSDFEPGVAPLVVASRPHTVRRRLVAGLPLDRRGRGAAGSCVSRETAACCGGSNPRSSDAPIEHPGASQGEAVTALEVSRRFPVPRVELVLSGPCADALACWARVAPHGRPGERVESGRVGLRLIAVRGIVGGRGRTQPCGVEQDCLWLDWALSWAAPKMRTVHGADVAGVEVGIVGGSERTTPTESS
jgi:hypothetical protein